MKIEMSLVENFREPFQILLLWLYLCNWFPEVDGGKIKNHQNISSLLFLIPPVCFRVYASGVNANCRSFLAVCFLSRAHNLSVYVTVIAKVLLR